MGIAIDKKLHAYVCCAYMVTIGALFLIWCTLLVALASGIISTLSLSIGKEYGDKCAKGNHWCWYDLLADCIGMIIGGIIVWLISLILA